jgi:hypothetical protein
MTKPFVQTFVLTIILVGLVGCRGGGEEATLPPPPTPPVSQPAAGEPINSEPSPAGGTPLATPTLPAPATAAALLTATLPPPPTATAAGESGATVIAPDAIAADRNPLTGEQVSDPAVLDRRPIAVKLSNAPATYTRPQAGLNQADLVFEHTTEGSVTRFTAIFYDETPPNVGPVRSARLIDLELPAMYDTMLAFSGASAGVNQRLNNSDFSDRLLRDGEPGFYRSGENKPFEHTLYIRLDELRQAVAAKGMDTRPQFQTFNSFNPTPPTGGTPAGRIAIDYQATEVEWQYDPATGRYRRWSDGQPHLDANTGEQVTAANLIVVSPFHVLDPTICEQINSDGTCAHLSVQIQLWGTGGAAVFRDGQRYDVAWNRVNRNDMLTFTDSSGNPFPLQIGNSWVQLVPSWLDNPVTVTP